MTPLKPVPNTTEVRGVLADRYQPNEVCAHPECDKPVESIHHIFGRPPGEHSDSWFVTTGPEDYMTSRPRGTPIPHAIGLCGSGTTGHHGDIDSGMGGHQAWIKLEDGVFVWYDRKSTFESERDGVPPLWEPVGPLDPQPAGRVKSGKPKRTRKKGADRENRRTISLAGPKEVEKPGLVWDELIEAAGAKLDRLMAEPGMKNPSEKSDWYTVVDSLNDWLTISDEASQ